MFLSFLKRGHFNFARIGHYYFALTSIVRKALVEVLKESHPNQEVVIYIQDDPAIGQTVFHSHEQVVSIDPETIALSWTLMSLYPSGNVSDEEMLQVREEFGLKMQKKIKEISELEVAM